MIYSIDEEYYNKINIDKNIYFTARIFYLWSNGIQGGSYLDTGHFKDSKVLELAMQDRNVSEILFQAHCDRQTASLWGLGESYRIARLRGITYIVRKNTYNDYLEFKDGTYWSYLKTSCGFSDKDIKYIESLPPIYTNLKTVEDSVNSLEELIGDL